MVTARTEASIALHQLRDDAGPRISMAPLPAVTRVAIVKLDQLTVRAVEEVVHLSLGQIAQRSIQAEAVVVSHALIPVPPFAVLQRRQQRYRTTIERQVRVFYQ